MACLRFARQEWEQRERWGYTARPVTPECGDGRDDPDPDPECHDGDRDLDCGDDIHDEDVDCGDTHDQLITFVVILKAICQEHPNHMPVNNKWKQKGRC